jgi:hypothetical protein
MSVHRVDVITVVEDFDGGESISSVVMEFVSVFNDSPIANKESFSGSPPNFRKKINLQKERNFL